MGINEKLTSDKGNGRGKVLVCIDCQNDFITGSLENKTAQERLSNVVSKIDNFNGELIIFTLDTHSSNYLNTREGRVLPVEHCIEETDGHKLAPEVQEAMERAKTRGVKIWTFSKGTFGYHWWTTILGRVDFEIIGFCTSICVITNAAVMRTVYPESEITVDASCCACVTEESHKAALESMKMFHINIINE